MVNNESMNNENVPSVNDVAMQCIDTIMMMKSEILLLQTKLSEVMKENESLKEKPKKKDS